MATPALTRDRVVEAAEDVIRRYGPAKATVLDVARVLEVSHGSVYRHFPTKAALHDAVAERWLGRVTKTLAKAAHDDGPAIDRLRRWLDTLIASRRLKAHEEPELFATYLALAARARPVIAAHLDALAAQLAHILTDGVTRGELATPDPASAGRALLDATLRFHDPAHATEWAERGIDDAFEAVWLLVLVGLGVTRLRRRGA